MGPTDLTRRFAVFPGVPRQTTLVCYSTGMACESSDQPGDVTGPSFPGIITWHGERETLWYVVDPTAPEAEQPAVLRTFSSRWATREDVRRFLEHSGGVPTES